jgi:hypothetical protein
MTPIKSQSFVITRLRQLRASLLMINIAKMPDSVCQHERFANLTKQDNGFFIAFSGHSTISASR